MSDTPLWAMVLSYLLPQIPFLLIYGVGFLLALYFLVNKKQIKFALLAAAFALFLLGALCGPVSQALLFNQIATNQLGAAQMGNYLAALNWVSSLYAVGCWIILLIGIFLSPANPAAENR